MIVTNKPTKRILGIDPGLAIIGFGAIEYHEQKVELIDFGVIETPPKTEIGIRLQIIYNDLHTLIQQLKPDLVAIEKFYFYRMGNTIQVAQARGVIVLVVAQNNLPVLEFTPSQVKQALTGYGNADKHQVQEAVTRELELSYIPNPDDAADALAMALTASYTL